MGNTMSDTTQATDTTIDTTIYDESVKEAKRVVRSQSNANWRLGDLALTVATTYGDNTITKFADAIGIASKTLYDLRKVAERYAAGERSTKNVWTVHQILMGQDDRAELVKKTMSTKQARDLVASRKAPAEVTETDADDTSESAEVIETDADKLARLQAREAQLVAELDKIRADIAAVQLKMGPVVHRVRGIKAHEAGDPKQAARCPECKLAEVPAA